VNDSLAVVLVVSGISFGTPVVFAAIGEILAERSGVLNIGIEGIMLVGAVCGYWGAQTTGLVWVGVVAGAAAGGALAAVFAFGAVSLRVNQIVMGLALTIFGGGLSSFIGVSGHPPLVGTTGRAHLGNVFGKAMADLPVAGPILFGHDLLVYLSWVVVAATSAYLFRTRRGLALRAVGDDPAAADSMGIGVAATRYVHVVLGGIGAGIGGAYVSLALIPTWVDGLTTGLGWIAIALVVVSAWRPWRALIAAYAFGALSRLAFVLQVHGIKVPAEFLGALPYVLAIIALVLITSPKGRRAAEAPVYLTRPFVREALT
jgi:simple sugar transport system permease protein